MILKSINVLMAYIIAVIFTAICVALTFYLPQYSDAAPEVSNKAIVDMIIVVSVSMVIFSSPITLIMGLLGYFKKITSPSFYAIAGVFAIIATLMFIPGLQGIKGDEQSLWVPFIGVIAAAFAGYIFWHLAIRRPAAKPKQT